MTLEDFAGFGIAGYRSYGSSEIQLFRAKNNVHLLVGKNNVGKSNALKAARTLLPAFASDKTVFHSALLGGARDLPDGWDPNNPRQVSLGLRLTPGVRSALRLPDEQWTDVGVSLLPLLETDAYRRGDDGVAWFDFDLETRDDQILLVPSRGQLETGLSQSSEAGVQLQSATRSFSNSTSSDPFVNFATIVERASLWRFVPPVEWIDAKRAIGDGSTVRPGDANGPAWRSGRGFIPELAKLQNPESDRYAIDHPKWVALEEFVRTVLEDPKANIGIPVSQTDLQVEMGGRRESYQDLGTGLTEIIHIAAVATLYSDHLICVEEPELHLHPTLQRKVLSYLALKTSNSYLVSTHSAQMLDSKLASITHITLDVNQWSQARPVLLRRDHAEVVADLGNRASDLVQSNFIIWVEGPSDRIYVVDWLSKIDESLMEGVHYQTMFYGGGLLSHLSVDDQEVADFIQLAQINRNLAVVIDSDRKSIGAGLNSTKRRVLAELAGSNFQGWVTEGYTIENYVPPATLGAVLLELYPDKSYALPAGIYSSPLAATFEGVSTKPSKVTVARAVVARNIGLDEMPTSLSGELASLAGNIRRANGLI